MAGDLVLLTGATGFIGFRTLVLLLEAGYKVRTAVRNAAGFEKIKALKSAAPYQSQMEQIIVPDITIPGAYDDAVKGVRYIVHIASPFSSPDLRESDWETGFIEPAVRGTVGMLESAATTSTVQRVVITGSVLSITGFGAFNKDVIVDENHRSADTTGPFPSWFAAYAASKALAFEATKKWMSDHKPSFDLITIAPVFVVGRDETSSGIQGLLKSQNILILGPLIGQTQPPAPCLLVDVNDVALMHARALDPTIPGNEFYLASSHSRQQLNWNQVFDIVKKHYPTEVAEGIFQVDPAVKPTTVIIGCDSSKAEKTFGITFKSFEEQVISAVDQYLELVGRK